MPCYIYIKLIQKHTLRVHEVNYPQKVSHISLGYEGDWLFPYALYFTSSNLFSHKMDDSQLVEINIVPLYTNGRNKDMESAKFK